MHLRRPAALVLAAVGLAAYAWSSPSGAGAPFVCPVTVPNGDGPPGEPTGIYVGNGDLWVIPFGTADSPEAATIRADGSIAVQVPWWQAAPGRLTIEATRLDGKAPSALAVVPSVNEQPGSQTSSLIFPTRGCWSVTGRVGPTSLTFVGLLSVGRDRRPVPLATQTAPLLHRYSAVLHWRGNAGAQRFDVAERRIPRGWRIVRSSIAQRRAFLQLKRGASYEARIRGADEFGAGPWSRVRRFSAWNGLIWPVHGPITSPFGYRCLLGLCRMHEGIDIGVPFGSAIHTAAAGTVVFAGWDGDYGNLVVIDHGGRLSTAYGHQSRIAARSGRHLAQGQVIGFVGCTGRCTGPHLHFEVRVNGSPVNPLRYL